MNRFMMIITKFRKMGEYPFGEKGVSVSEKGIAICSDSSDNGISAQQMRGKVVLWILAKRASLSGR
jgi:hypothetical protein